MINKFYKEVIRLHEQEGNNRGYTRTLLTVSYYNVFGVPGFLYSIYKPKNEDLRFFSAYDILDQKYQDKNGGENTKNFEEPMLDLRDLFCKNSEFLSGVVGKVELDREIIYFWKTSFVVLKYFGPLKSILVCTSKESEVSELVKLVKIYVPEPNGRVIYRYLVYEEGGISERVLGFDKFQTDLEKYYNSDLPWERLNKFVKERSEGLALLYGDPGGGKTSIIKYLISENPNENFILSSGSELQKLDNSDLMSYLLNNRESIIILEDCESLLATRTRGADLSALLNLTDGILGASLKIRFICTFNTNLGNVDPALLRKGRLKLKYEFKKLSLEKTRNLVPDATSSMYLSEIFGIAEENDFSKKQNKIGF